MQTSVFRQLHPPSEIEITKLITLPSPRQTSPLLDTISVPDTFFARIIFVT